MKIGLNGWLRLAFVASVLWAIGGSVHQMTSDAKAATAVWLATDQHCESLYGGPLGPSPTTMERCARDASSREQVVYDGMWADVAMFAFLPVLIAWPVALAAVFAGRWAWRGLRLRPGRGGASPRT